MQDIAIIGGGASGLVCAIAAAMTLGENYKICILERMDRVGKKLLATGNGRCNITNVNDNVKFFHGDNREIINSVIGEFGYEETISFFEKIGLLCKEENGRMYPYCMQASAVLDTLRNAISNRGIQEKCDFEVSSIEKKEEIFIIRSSKGDVVYAKRAVLATGGQASPNLGSNGSGYKLASNFGHTLTKRYPALVQLKSDNPRIKSLNGIKVSGTVKAIIDDDMIQGETGEVLFTEYGLSGIPIMQLSRFYGSKKTEAEMRIAIDLMPEYSHDSLISLLQIRRDKKMFETLETFLIGLLNKKVGYALMKNTNLSPLSKRTDTLTNEQLGALASQIKHFEFNITGDMSWNNAQVTAGGIQSTEFDSQSLESLKVKGLYAAGELFDVFGDCGGYNLQWAWATGVRCGISSAMSLK